jgi:hypothetical protein
MSVYAPGEKRPADWESAGGGLGDMVASRLVGMGYANAYPYPVSVALCPEPIVVNVGPWEREIRQDGEERGSFRADVLVCCDDPADAQSTCRAAERDLHGAGWDFHLAGWHMSLVGVDTTAPESRGRDRSGRWLWGFALTLTVVREL